MNDRNVPKGGRKLKTFSVFSLISNVPYQLYHLPSKVKAGQKALIENLDMAIAQVKLAETVWSNKLKEIFSDEIYFGMMFDHDHVPKPINSYEPAHIKFIKTVTDILYSLEEILHHTRDGFKLSLSSISNLPYLINHLLVLISDLKILYEETKQHAFLELYNQIFADLGELSLKNLLSGDLKIGNLQSLAELLSFDIKNQDYIEEKIDSPLREEKYGSDFEEKQLDEKEEKYLEDENLDVANVAPVTIRDALESFVDDSEVDDEIMRHLKIIKSQISSSVPKDGLFKIDDKDLELTKAYKIMCNLKVLLVNSSNKGFIDYGITFKNAYSLYLKIWELYDVPSNNVLFNFLINKINQQMQAFYLQLCLYEINYHFKPGFLTNPVRKKFNELVSKSYANFYSFNNPFLLRNDITIIPNMRKKVESTSNKIEAQKEILKKLLTELLEEKIDLTECFEKLKKLPDKAIQAQVEMLNREYGYAVNFPFIPFVISNDQLIDQVKLDLQSFLYAQIERLEAMYYLEKSKLQVIDQIQKSEFLHIREFETAKFASLNLSKLIFDWDTIWQSDQRKKFLLKSFNELFNADIDFPKKISEIKKGLFLQYNLADEDNKYVFVKLLFNLAVGGFVAISELQPVLNHINTHVRNRLVSDLLSDSAKFVNKKLLDDKSQFELVIKNWLFILNDNSILPESPKNHNFSDLLQGLINFYSHNPVLEEKHEIPVLYNADSLYEFCSQFVNADPKLIKVMVEHPALEKGLFDYLIKIKKDIPSALAIVVEEINDLLLKNNLDLVHFDKLFGYFKTLKIPVATLDKLSYDNVEEVLSKFYSKYIKKPINQPLQNALNELMQRVLLARKDRLDHILNNVKLSEFILNAITLNSTFVDELVDYATSFEKKLINDLAEFELVNELGKALQLYNPNLLSKFFDKLHVGDAKIKSAKKRYLASKEIRKVLDNMVSNPILVLQKVVDFLRIKDEQTLKLIHEPKFDYAVIKKHLLELRKKPDKLEQYLTLFEQFLKARDRHKPSMNKSRNSPSR